jgi:hypothetical protein
VRAADLKEYLEMGQATPEMRRVRFDLRDRLALIPVELVHVFLPTLLVSVALWLVVGPLAGMAAWSAVLAGTALFPILLPWLPTRQFSSQGLILGAIVALPFAVIAFVLRAASAWWLRLGWTLAYLLAMPPVTAFLALNFTGSTTFTSRSGVRREMMRYIPVMAWTFGVGTVLTIALAVTRFFV